MVGFKAGTYRQGYKYKWFLPESINKIHYWSNPDINVLLEKTAKYLGELKVQSSLIPDINFYIKMHIATEATLSSRIEGTNTKINEVFSEDSPLNAIKRDDLEEVKSYIKAINSGIEKLKKLPISRRLIGKIHKTLLSTNRGYSKSPGEIRKSQNWIGGNNLKNARFIPPHPDELNQLLSDLDNFWHNDELKIPNLIKIAIYHYQFETIHPFLDGNGRVGRLLIILQLIEKNFLNHPAIYLSYFIDKRRLEYYNALNIVRTDNNLDEWIKYFLEILNEAAINGIKTFDRIRELDKHYNKIIESRIGIRRQILSKQLLRRLYSNPIFTIKQSSEMIDCTFQTALNIINKMETIGIVYPATKQKRNRVFILKDYMKIFEDK